MNYKRTDRPATRRLEFMCKPHTEKLINDLCRGTNGKQIKNRSEVIRDAVEFYYAHMQETYYNIVDK